MRMKIVIFAASFLTSCALLVALVTAANGASDTYSDGRLTVQWAQSGDDFSGTFTLGSRQFPATAHAASGRITGSFVSGTNQFPFTASIEGDTLALTTGGTTYALKSQSAAANPLAPANPLAANAPSDTGAPGNTGVPPGYTIITTNDAGKVLCTQKDGATSVQAALEATFPELAKYFNDKLTIDRAYQDAKDPKSGGATFGSTFSGQPVKGIVSCKINDKGAQVVVIYARADATKDQWDKLLAPAPPPQQQQASAAAPTPAGADGQDVPLQEYDFPDGTGSMGLAQGWTTKSQTAIRPVAIMGPDHQEIEIGVSVMVQYPPTQQTRQKQAFGYGGPPPPPRGLVAPLAGPVEALQSLLPQFSKLNQANNGPSLTLDKIISSQDMPTQMPNAKSSLIVYDYTMTENGQSFEMRAEMQATTGPSAFPGAWGFGFNSVAGPRSTFDQNAPLMKSMAHSFKMNFDRAKEVITSQNQQMFQQSQARLDQINAVGQANLQAQRQEMQQYHDQEAADYQARRDAQQQSFADHNQQWAQQETQKQQAAADVIEQIRGTREIYDTQTGAQGTASLYNVTGVVNSLNQAALDPNRFIQVPLRNTFYAPTPVPGQ